MVREIYSLRETLTKNFEANSTNVTESNERMKIRTDERKDENYITLGINAGGMIKQLSTNSRCYLPCYKNKNIKKTSKNLFPLRPEKLSVAKFF